MPYCPDTDVNFTCFTSQQLKNEQTKTRTSPKIVKEGECRREMLLLLLLFVDAAVC